MRKLLYIICICSFWGCKDIPVERYERSHSSKFNEKISAINTYRDSVDMLNKPNALLHSLIFSKDDYSFYAGRYVNENRSNLYIERGIKQNTGFSEKRFYLQKGNLILYQELHKENADSTFKLVQTVYFSDKEILDIKKPNTQLNLLSTEGYQNLSVKIRKNLNVLVDAMYQRGEFELSFDGFANYPGARYLILNNEITGSYRVALKVEKQDEFIKMLIDNPEKFMDRKLILKWQLRKPFEVVYVGGKFD